MQLRRSIMALALAALAATSAFAAGSKDTFIYGLDGDPGNAINVITTGDRYGLMSIKLLYSPLYMYNADSKVFFLAESLSASADHLTYTAKLRKNVKWHDGVPFTADDVVFTYEAMLKESNGGWAYGQLQLGGKPVEVKKIDDYSVAFKFPAVSAAAEELIANIFIMPKHVYEGEKDIATSPKNAAPVGTGPYKFKEYKSGEYLKFEANPDYFLGAPKIKNVVFRVIGDPNTAGLALQNGEIGALAVAPADALKYKNNARLSVIPYDEGRIAYLSFNFASPATASKDLRKALAFAIDRADVIKAAFLSESFAVPAYTFLPNESPYHSDKVEKYATSAAKAKEYLAKSGAKNPKLKLAYAGNNKQQAAQAMIIQQAAKKVGIQIELVGMDATALYKKLTDKSSDFDLFLGGYIMGIDPDTFNGLFVSGDASNYGHYANKAVDELFAKGRIETDVKKRSAIYAEIQRVLQDDLAIYPLAESKRVLVIDSSIGGLKAAGLVPVYTFEDMSKIFYK